MKKKYLIIGMTAIMGISLVACEQKKQETTTTEIITEEKEDLEQEEIEEQNSTEEKTEESVHNEIKKPVIEVKDFSEEEAEDVTYFYGSYQMAEVTGEDYPELKSAITDWFENYKNNYDTEAQEIITNAKLDAEMMGEDFLGYSLKKEVKVSRADDQITSLAMDSTTYTGGAHGSMMSYGITFNSKTGEELTFEMLGDIREDVKEYITQYIEEKREEEYLYESYEDNIDSILDSPNWYLSETGLEFIFNEYDIASYAEGQTIVTIPYVEMENFNKDYLIIE